MPDAANPLIVAEGDVPKVEPTLRYFTELRASLKNALDVQTNIGLQMAELVTTRDRLVAERAQIDRLREERDRYREALERVYQTGKGVHVEIAREALNRG